MSLFFLELLKDLPGLDQLSHSFTLAVGEFREIARQRDRLGLVDEGLALFQGPVTSGKCLRQ